MPTKSKTAATTKTATKTTKSAAPAKRTAARKETGPKGAGKTLATVKQFSDGTVALVIGSHKFPVSQVNGKMVASHPNTLRKGEEPAYLEMSPLRDLLERLSNKGSPLWKAAEEI